MSPAHRIQILFLDEVAVLFLCILLPEPFASFVLCYRQDQRKEGLVNADFIQVVPNGDECVLDDECVLGDVFCYILVSAIFFNERYCVLTSQP
jgi:hypothetical protein